MDYDNDRNPFTLRQLRTTAAWLHQQRVAIVRVEIAATRKGHHLRAWTDTPIGPYRTLRIQTMLGDDPFRQAFNLRRVRKHEEGWNVLWNEKYRNGRLIMQEAVDPTMTQQAHRILQCPTPKPSARKPNRPTRRPNSGSNSSSSRRGG